MQCRSCGATIHEGDSFCRTCAMPVNMNPNAVIEDIANPATNDFMAGNNIPNNNYSVPQQENSFYNEPSSGRITESKIGFKDNNDNKKHIKKDGNDRLSATIANFISLVILLVIVAVIGYFIYEYVFKSMM